MRFRYIGLHAIEDRGRIAVRAALGEAGDTLRDRARIAAPKDSGALAAGITRDAVIEWGDHAFVVVHTGAAARAYAQYIHEGHNTHGTHIIGAYPGGSKYLEGPLLGMRAELTGRLRAAARAAY